MGGMARTNQSSLGPGLMITAAFIGPGTIATASQVGSRLGMTIAWALLFSLLATYVLQELALRLGLVHRLSLAALLRQRLRGHWLALPIWGLVLLAIVFGNAAYQSGNVTGAAVGAASLLAIDHSLLVFFLAVLAGGILWSSRYALLEKVLTGLVGLMALTFIVTAGVAMTVMPLPVSTGWVSAWPTGQEMLLVALIGTTVVPYNLFLHASLVQEKWGRDVPLVDALQAARRDLLLYIGIGGMVTLAVMVCAYAAFYGRVEPSSLSAFADQLRPLLGDVSGVCFALGLLAAGLTSALTAPLAGAYVVTGIFGRGEASNHQLFRGTWVLILVCGAVVASLQTTPLTAIIVAQYANGLLLPVLATVLIVLARQSASDIDKTPRDKGRTLAAILVVGFCILLAVLKLG